MIRCTSTGVDSLPATSVAVTTKKFAVSLDSGTTSTKCPGRSITFWTATGAPVLALEASARHTLTTELVSAVPVMMNWKAAVVVSSAGETITGVSAARLSTVKLMLETV
jgi:hypothetical protein